MIELSSFAGVRPARLAALMICMLSLAVCASSARAISLAEHPKLLVIADELVTEGYYSRAELDEIFAGADIQQSVLDAMQNPAEYKFTWGKYRKLFLKEERISQGVEFWHQYEESLSRAEREYGVPASVIVAIIGVESKFGRYRGKHKVLDSLVSLVVGYPRRSAFFGKELKQFLILTKENQLDSNAILGSYAGAVGYPQFISSSYRNYAIDFSGDGVIDLIDQPVDAIGSVANYFIENGWKPGEPVTSEPHTQVSQALRDRANRKREVRYTAQELRAWGAMLAPSIPDSEQLNVLLLDAREEVNEPRRSNIYVVRAGDTACQIAEKYEVSCKQIFVLNNLDKRGSIYRGQRLKLPAAKAEKVGKWSVKNNMDEETRPQDRFFFTHRNFYAITQYNHSVLYAMAVHELSKAVASAKAVATASTVGFDSEPDLAPVQNLPLDQAVDAKESPESKANTQMAE